jgi:YebC/PmpR family DNA-binding regulatory protein
VALIVDTMTDNPTRTVADVRHKFSRAGGNLGTPGSVAFMFDKKGQIELDATKYADEDTTLEAALEAGAEDFRREGDVYLVTTEPNALYAVKSALEAKGIVATEAEIAMVPKNTVPVTSKDDVSSLFKLIEALEELDDVQKVWGNFEIDDADLADL